MAKKAGRKAKGRKTPSRKKAGTRARVAARKVAGARRKTAKRGAARKPTTRVKAKRPASKARKAASRATGKRPPSRAKGGTGMERTLAQTPETGRTVRGRTNPMPTKRSTGTPSGAGNSRRVPGLERERKRLREVDETVQGPPSSLNMDRHGSAARSGRAAFEHTRQEHTETSPAMTGGDVDADWEDAYATGDETPGGDNPTPDQDRVDDIGKALGVQYEDNEELKAADKITKRDKHRWELDPASSEDYQDREKE